MREPDPEVVRAAAAGDLGAFEVIVRTFQEPLVRFLTGMVGDPALAEDLAQDTFVRAYQHLRSFRFRSRFSTWLFQVARNLAIDALRSRERRALVGYRLGSTDLPPGPEVGAEVRAALRSLSPKLREAVLLVEVMGFSCRDAARILRIPEGTVKSRLFHARSRLLDWYAASEEADGAV